MANQIRLKDGQPHDDSTAVVYVASPAPVRAAPQRLAAIDGLRALAVALVVAYHFDLYLPGGFLGVDLFFAISGFVITRQLLTSLATSTSMSTSTPTKDLLISFYRRRATRLMPAAVMLCVGVVLLSNLFPDVLGDPLFTLANAVAGLSGIGNWFNLRNTEMLPNEARPLMHLWSLSIEEQFYLLLPLLMVIKRGRAAQAAIAVGTVAIVVPTLVAVAGQDAHQAFFSTASRVAPMGAGVILAVLLQSERLNAQLAAWKLRTLTLIALILGLVLLSATTSWNTPWLRFGGFVALAAPFALIVGLCAVPGNSMVDRLLCHPISQAIAVRSYSLYLWHFPVAFLFGSFSMLPRLALRIVVSGLLCELSLRCIERPARQLHTTPLAWFAPLTIATSSMAFFAFTGLSYAR